MCGIFGALRKVPANGGNAVSNGKLVDFVKEAMDVSQIRGTDSTGLARIDGSYKLTPYEQGRNKELPKEDSGRVTVIKEPISAKSFIKSERVKGLLKIHDYTDGIIGHTRNASSASPVNNRNNHPHICNTIIGVHNGNIANWRQLAKKYNLKLKSNCDSEVIFAMIEKFIYEGGKSLEEAIQYTSLQLEGSYACVVLDSRHPSFVAFFRHNAPLYFRFRSTNSTLFFASTHEILTASYLTAKVDGDTHSKFYMDSGEIWLPNDCGYIFNTKKNYSDDWVKKATPFRLE